jgi:hypothetical protein
MRRIAFAAKTEWVSLLVSVVVGASVLTADSIQPVYDALCAAPKLRMSLTGNADSVGVLEGTEDLNGGEWRPLLQLGAISGHHEWMDPENRAQARRFYRLNRSPRPPLLPVPNFRLNDHQGFSHELFREGDARAVVLVFTEAQGMESHWRQLKPIVEAQSAAGVQFWMVDPMDDRSAMAAAATRVGVTIPVLQDSAQLVARSYGASASGEAVVLEAESLTTVYRGAIEDAFEVATGSPVRQAYLADALTRFTAGERPVVEYSRTQGQPWRLEDSGVASYRNEIAPLLQAKCVTCHRPGEIGSWAITNHATVQAKSAAIRANVLESLMPPWHADPAHGKFENDFSLTPQQQARLIAWLDAGAPREAGTDPLETVPPSAGLWPMGQPNVVLKISTRQIQATGQMPYAYVTVNNPLKTNAWLRAAVIRPGNRAVVHHALIFYIKAGSPSQMAADFLAIQGGLNGYYAGYVPGMDQREYPAGTAKYLPAGGALVFQMHYTPNGKSTTDATEMGLYLSPTPPAMELKTGAASSTAIDIPAGERNHRMVAERSFDKAVDIHELSPHMHFRGDSMRFEAFLPDGSSQILLNVPKYDFNWQALYRLSQPVRLPAGSRIRISGGFDNSRWNPFNPDAKSRVRFGEQTDDEMFIGYVNYSEVQ